MAKVMVSLVSSVGPPTLDEIASRFAIPENMLDRDFGVVEVDDLAHEYTILIEEDAASRMKSSADWRIAGKYSNPKIAPFGPVEGD